MPQETFNGCAKIRFYAELPVVVPRGTEKDFQQEQEQGSDLGFHT